MDCSSKHKIKLLNKVGKGAFGEVYKGTYDGELCAVKTLPHGMEGDHVAFQMFHREANVLRGFSHKRIIQFKALCKLNPDEKKHGGKWALVLEFAKGGTLSDKVVQSMVSPGSKVYSTGQALSWAHDVATALEYLHSQSPAVLHRDVKLGNIVICKEGAEWVAKLGDFGLHVVADSMRDRLLRVSFRRGPNNQLSHFFTQSSSCSAPITPVAKQQAGTGAPAAAQPSGSEPGDSTSSSCRGPALHGGRTSAELTQQHIQELQQRLMQDVAADTAVTEVQPVLDKDSAQEQLDTLCIPTVHSSGGAARSTSSMPGRTGASCDDLYLPGPAPNRTHSTPISASADGGLLQVTQQAAATIQSAGDSARLPVGARRTVSFQQDPSRADDVRCSYTDDVGVQHAADLHAAWGDDPFGDEDGSMCSMVTDGTWVSGDTCATADTGDTAPSTEGAPEGSSWTDVETVFNMTGQTGSCLYMAPEVHLGQPYNEKADVFSFGVVLYELMARCMVLFTELPRNSTDPAITEQYADKVAGGYRPSRPKHLSGGVWQLIEACWQQEPSHRPSMSKVVNTLQQLLHDEQQAAPAALGRRPSLNLAASSPASNLKQPAESASDAPAAKSNPTSSAGAAALSIPSSIDDAPVGGQAQKHCGCVIC